MKRTSALLSVFSLFLSGLAIGALGMHLYHGRSGPPTGPHFVGPPHGRMLAMLERRLDLTPEQREQVVAIHEESRRASHEIRRELRPQLERQMEETREKIRAILTPEQQARFDELHEELKSRFGRFLLGEGRHGRGGRGGRGPGRGPGPPPDRP